MLKKISKGEWLRTTRNPFSIACTILFLLSFHTEPTVAANVDSWGPIDGQNGSGAAVCSDRYGQDCIRVSCNPDSGLQIELFMQSNGGAQPTISLSIDRSMIWTVNDGVSIDGEADPGRSMIEGLASGTSAFLEDGTTSKRLSLRGSSKRIDSVKSGCASLRERLTSGQDPFAGRTFAAPTVDDATFPRLKEGEDFNWNSFQNTDLPGSDLWGGQGDPLLRGMSTAQCQALCRVHQECYFFTQYRGSCMLKGKLDKSAAFRGATSGQWYGSKDFLNPPQTSGSGPVADAAVRWRESDTIESQQERVRKRSVALGDSCQTERAVIEDYASSFEWVSDDDLFNRVGKTADIRYIGGEALSARIPIWFLISANMPVRTSGLGHIALGPASPNPFGIKPGLGRSRALVPLFSRGAAKSGVISFAPLRAGLIEYDISLVAYLRECDETVVLKKAEARRTVEAANARIVLNTAESRSSYTHRVDIERQNREILLNERRILVRDSDTATEIVERAGRNLIISPTHRFAVLEQNGRTEIVDLIDGATVANLAVGEVYWAIGDGFVMVARAPWGEIDIASTFGSAFRLKDQITGPSCCSASPKTTHVSFDLENGAFSVLGSFGHAISPLTRSDYLVRANSSGAYSSSESSSTALHYYTYAALGTVAPVTLSTGFSAAGGVHLSASYADDFIESAETYESVKRRYDERLQIVLDRVELDLEKLGRQQVAAARSDAVGLAGNSAPPETLLRAQLERIGITLADLSKGELLLSPPPYNGFERERYVQSTEANVDRAASTMNRFVEEASNRGWSVKRAEIADYGALSECYHLGFDDDSESPDNSARVPFDVHTVSRAETAAGPIWLAQARCTAGATFGSLRDVSAIYLMDLAAEAPRGKDAFLLNSAGSLENNYQPQWWDGSMRVKADTDFVLAYSPGEGAIMLRDRKRMDYLFIDREIPNGDLLVEAWLTEDRRFIVQLNSDGNFYLHRVASEKADRWLSGRLVDDEVAIWSAEYRYDATAEAAMLIDLTFPGKLGQYSLDRFGASLRVDDLATRMLAEQPLPSKAVATITPPPDLDGTISLSSTGMIEADLRFDPARTAEIAMFQDGVHTEVKDIRQSSGSLIFERLPGTRIVSIVATDYNGLASLPLTKDLGPPPNGDTTKRRALAVGINTYDDPAIPSIDFALRDAGLILETLADLKFGDVPAFGTITGLKDTAATPEAILSETDMLLEGLGKGDHAVLFFAGHGLQAEDGRFYLATSNTDPSNLSGTALDFARLRERLLTTDARITILLDACHSGAAGDGLFATNDALVTDLSKLASNMTIIAAAKGRQTSQEVAAKGGGLFSNAFASVVAQERDLYDLNDNGRIEASELYQGIKGVVVQASQRRQTPWIVRSRMVGDYALF